MRVTHRVSHDALRYSFNCDIFFLTRIQFLCQYVRHVEQRYSTVKNALACDMYKVWDFLTHWGRVTHICVRILTIIGSDNGLSPGRRQAIIWTNAGILLIGPLGENFNDFLIEIHGFHSQKFILKCRLENVGLDVLKKKISASMC